MSLKKDVVTERIVWIDMEMTGLDVLKDKIMEVACLVTNMDLDIVAEMPNIIIRQEKKDLEEMDEWCKTHHEKSGLTSACLSSQISLSQAEDQLLKFTAEHTNPRSSPLAGNSIYMDRFFLRQHMPKVDEYLHYRLIDVSSIRELCRRWNYELYKKIPPKKMAHRADSDIRESIEELKWLRQNFFVCDGH